MNIEQLREYCLSLPDVQEGMPFGDDTLVFRLKDKIFACVYLGNANRAAMKCDAEMAAELRALHPEITGAWHWNKRYWNDVSFEGELTDAFIMQLVRHAYNEVNKKLPKIARVNPLPEQDEIRNITID